VLTGRLADPLLAVLVDDGSQRGLRELSIGQVEGPSPASRSIDEVVRVLAALSAPLR
jgi:hypothetical protein